MCRRSAVLSLELEQQLPGCTLENFSCFPNTFAGRLYT